MADYGACPNSVTPIAAGPSRSPPLRTTFPFSCGLARVEVAKRLRVIDQTGRDVTPPEVDHIGLCSQGLLRIWKGRKQGYMNGTGAIVIEPQFDGAEEFKDGLARVWVAGKYGYIDRSGKMAIAPRFATAESFSDGLALVKEDEKTLFIDKSGKAVLEPDVQRAYPLGGLLCRALGRQVRLHRQARKIRDRAALQLRPPVLERPRLCRRRARRRLHQAQRRVRMAQRRELIVPLGAALGAEVPLRRRARASTFRESVRAAGRARPSRCHSDQALSTPNRRRGRRFGESRFGPCRAVAMKAAWRKAKGMNVFPR